MRRSEFTIVEYFSEREGQRCGYCKSTRSYISCGIWAHSMGVMEYQLLLDRGWRRSGRYMYKPKMNQTCCPMYTIRCDVRALQLSKSQKKVLKKFHNHIRFGDTSRNSNVGVTGDIRNLGHVSSDMNPSHIEHAASQPAAVEFDKIQIDTSPTKEEASSSINSKHDTTNEDKQLVDVNVPSTSAGERGAEDEMGEHQRPRKAKLIRLENKFNRLRSRGMTEEEAISLTYSHKKTSTEKKIPCFEDYFPTSEEVCFFTHRFRTALCHVTEVESNEEVLHETHRLYTKYQMAVHGDSPEDCSLRQLKRFLVDSPLFDNHPNRPPPLGFGSFHQQYWLDGKLIAVGVVDILPHCLSSVYFFYDPDLRHLSLGTYGSLQEIYYTRSLKVLCPDLKFYYMGYYIHSCSKMNYKGRYHPSHLLCPETYTWHDINKCLVSLEKNKYCRFEEDPSVIDKSSTVNLEKVMILNKNRAMGYVKYKATNPEADDEEEVTEYAKLVGEECYQNILLFRG